MAETIEELKERIVLDVLEQMITHPDAAEIQVFIDQPNDRLYGYHLSLGRDIRNNYELWGHPTLTQAYTHPDDFSADVIKEVHARAVIRFRKSIFSIK